MSGINRVETDPHGRLTTRRGFQLSSDQLQNELLVLSHHLDDMEEAINNGDSEYALMGLKDCREIIERLSNFLPQSQSSEIERMAESISDEEISYL